ncbi:MAG: hypothetical protein ACK5MV_00105 [Aminipila sp.]
MNFNLTKEPVFIMRMVLEFRKELGIMNGTEFCMRQPSCHECKRKCKEYFKSMDYSLGKNKNKNKKGRKRK